MAALVKKAPALLAAAKELATPKLNTFLRYAKVNVLLEMQRSKFRWKLKILRIFEQVELVPPTPAEIPAAIADISTKVGILLKRIYGTVLGQMPNKSMTPGLVTVSLRRNC